ncbi:MAG: hypothetical protein U0263_25845 [Polyangiaceae bacterium]
MWRTLRSMAWVLLLTACGSDDEKVSGGTGATGGTGGSSVTCTPGDTRACVGPGACNGGQQCSASGVWGTCDCGAGSGGFPSGGSGGLDAGGGSGGSGTGASSGTGGTPPTSLDLHDATLFDNPTDLADWPVTTTITALDFQHNGQDGVWVEFSKKDGADRWPDVTPPGWTGPLQYTLGLAEFIDGKWYASAAIQYWYGLEASGGNVALDNQIAKNWYYDDRWGNLKGYQPKTGEIIGVFVVAGNVRGVKDGSQSPMKERSNVVLVPMPDVNGAKHTFP